MHEPAGQFLTLLQRKLRGVILNYVGASMSFWRRRIEITSVYAFLREVMPLIKPEEIRPAIGWLLFPSCGRKPFLTLIVELGVRYLQLTAEGWEIVGKRRVDWMVMV